jgi:hypothetical protein
VFPPSSANIACVSPLSSASFCRCSRDARASRSSRSRSRRHPVLGHRSSRPHPPRWVAASASPLPHRLPPLSVRPPRSLPVRCLLSSRATWPRCHAATKRTHRKRAGHVRCDAMPVGCHAAGPLSRGLHARTVRTGCSADLVTVLWAAAFLCECSTAGDSARWPFNLFAISK